MPKETTGVVALLNAASANPLPKEEVIARLDEALQRNLSYWTYRQRRYKRALCRESTQHACHRRVSPQIWSWDVAHLYPGS